MNSLGKSLPATQEQQLRRATAEQVRSVFTAHGKELLWLALFLTGNEGTAEVCVENAFVLATTHSDVFPAWLDRWSRRATIRAAIEMQRSHIEHRALEYTLERCAHRRHTALSAEAVELIIEHSAVIRAELDLLCRFALVARGLEKYSALDSALMLGISKNALEAAYCAALKYLQILTCRLAVQPDEELFACR